MAKKQPDMYENQKRKNVVENNTIRIPEKQKKKVNADNLHEGHRERLRKRFLNDGLENFEDHNILELLLFYSIVRKDTNKEAHTLINEFGSLSNVFDASYEELCQVSGIGERTATLIKLVPELFRKYETDKLNKVGVILNSAELVAQYTSKYFKGLTEERLYLLCLNSNAELIRFDMISSGNVNSTPLNNRMITEMAFNTKAASIILVHNHPSGITAPSRMDIDATRDIAYAMKLIGLRLSDHIIIGHGDDFFSFRRSQKFKDMF